LLAELESKSGQRRHPVSFKIGDKVVYPNYGVTVVERITAERLEGPEAEPQQCYHLRLLSNNAQIMVPMINADLVGLRPLCGAGQIREVFTVLENGLIDTYKDWKGRYKQNLDKMRTGDLLEVSEVLKNLRLVSERKSLSFREKKMFEKARNFLVSEVAHVREINEEQAGREIDQALSTGLARRLSQRKAAENEAAAIAG
jgi:CarD family transcriptional regulator